MIDALVGPYHEHRCRCGEAVEAKCSGCDAKLGVHPEELAGCQRGAAGTVPTICPRCFLIFAALHKLELPGPLRAVLLARIIDHAGRN